MNFEFILSFSMLDLEYAVWKLIFLYTFNFDWILVIVGLQCECIEFERYTHKSQPYKNIAYSI